MSVLEEVKELIEKQLDRAGLREYQKERVLSLVDLAVAVARTEELDKKIETMELMA